jgi:hypothetical protein
MARLEQAQRGEKLEELFHGEVGEILNFEFWILNGKRSASWAGAIHGGNANFEHPFLFALLCGLCGSAVNLHFSFSAFQFSAFTA